MKDLRLLAYFFLTQVSIIGMLSSCGSTSEDKKEDDVETIEENSEPILNYDECLGDYISLQTDVNKVFIDHLKDGSIVLGKTSKSEMEELTGASESLTKNYEGLSLTAYYTYQNDILQSIAIDCFYHCDGALELLPVDQSAITNSITKALDLEPEQIEGSALVIWTINGMSIRKSNLDDGYGIYIDAEI